MKNQLLLAMLCLAFAMQISGQTQIQRVPVVITSEYYAGPKTLVVHAHNNSGRDIIGYSFIIRHKNSDGTPDKEGWSSTSSDMLNLLITAQMAKDPAASESIRMQSAGVEAMYAAGNGIFAAGTTRDMTLNGMNSASESDITAGVVFYADSSFDNQDEEPFKQMLALRQGQLLAMKKVNEVIKNALADPANDHPSTAVITELTKYLLEVETRKYDAPYDPERDQRMSLENDVQNLRNFQQPQKGTTERELLSQYVEEQEKRIELMTPHCHLEIDLKK